MGLGLALRELQIIDPCTYVQGVLWYGVNLGGPPGARTPDPLIKSQLLYQLS